jgi:hypothetical protein
MRRTSTMRKREGFLLIELFKKLVEVNFIHEGEES